MTKQHDEAVSAAASEQEAEQAQAESLFRTSELFRGLDDDEVREVVRASELVAYQPGEKLFLQDDPAQALYIVNHGEVEVRATTPMGEEIVLAVLGQGTVVGEMSLIEGGPRSATVIAMDDCRVFRLSREAFESLRQQKRPAAYKIILRLAATVGERRRRADARLQEVFDDPASHVDTFESQVHEMLGRIRKA